MKMHRTLVAACCTLLLATVLLGAPAASAPPAPVHSSTLNTMSGGAAAPPAPVPDYLRAYSIIPPGQSAGGPHGFDQYEMYKDLIEDDEVTDPDLDTLFHSFRFGPGATIENEYSPRPDVTIYRDTFGIPHVYGTTDPAAGYGLGYATAEDRMWHMDVLRHAALGRLSEILGRDSLAFDKDLRRGSYSAAELQKMYDRVEERFGATGEQLKTLLDAYRDGVNAVVAEIKAGTRPMPIEYSTEEVPLQRWRSTDTIALAIFQLRQFGETAGAELEDAAFYQKLRARLGNNLGTKVFRNLNFLNDADAYASIPESEGVFPSQDLGPTNPDAIAIPDNAAAVWRRVTQQASAAQDVSRAIALNMPASHFLAVAPSESETGNSLEWGGPQVGYSVPQFFIEIDVHSPSLDFRGPALPGASLLVPLGRGPDFAWSLTTGVSDAVDTRVERICGQNRYRYGGRCRRMQERAEVIQIGSGGSARKERIKIFRTVHGPVIARATVDGDPVAIVRERLFWKREINTLPALYNIASNSMDTLDEFKEQVAKFTMSFNVIYVDEENIAYFHAGKYPERRRGVDPMLPTWGTAKWDWRGTIPFEEHPQMVNPEQGWVANWNNKPAAGWNNGDAGSWGPTHRVRLLADKMNALVAGAEQASLAEIVDVIRESATQDARAVYLGNDMLGHVSGATGTEAEARDAVADWIAAGAHRLDQNGDEDQDSGPAVAVFDRWYVELVHRIFDDEIGNNYDLAPTPLTDDASVNNGSSYFADFSMYLWHLFEDGGAGYIRDYCDDLDTPAPETCEMQVQAALTDTVAELTAAQGNTVADWTHPADYIEFQEIGGLAMPPMPWQNRGTYNHAIEVTGSRP